MHAYTQPLSPALTLTVAQMFSAYRGANYKGHANNHGPVRRTEAPTSRPPRPPVTFSSVSSNVICTMLPPSASKWCFSDAVKMTGSKPGRPVLFNTDHLPTLHSCLCKSKCWAQDNFCVNDTAGMQILGSNETHSNGIAQLTHAWLCDGIYRQ